MEAALLTLARLAAVAAAAGLGPYALLARGRWRQPLLLVPLLVNCGLGLVALVSVYLIYLERPVALAVPVGLLLSLILLALALILRPRRLAACARALAGGLSRCALRSVLILAASLACFWPSLVRRGGQPFRVGVDQIGYATTAQYLKDGGTRTMLAAAVVRETGQPTLAKALEAKFTALNFNVSTAAEFILKSQRSGYPGLVAALLGAVGVARVVDAQFILLFFPLWLMAAVTAEFLLSDLGFSPLPSALWGIALAFNCNLLNVLYEGQHSQVFTEPLFAILFVTWWRWRGAAGKGAMAAPANLALAVYVFAVLFATYSEQVVVLGVLGAIVAACDFFASRGRFNASSAWLLAACAAGLALTGPYGLAWLPFIVRHAAHVAEGVSGFWQPQWAQLTDILGYNNIYAHAAPVLFGRSPWVSLALGLVTLVLVEAIAYRLWRARADWLFWLAPFAFVAVVLFKCYFLDRTINYNYMKAYTLVLFPMTLVSAWFIRDVVAGALAALRMRFLAPAPLIALPALAVVLVGLGYLRDYDREGSVAPAGWEAVADPRVSALVGKSALVSSQPGTLSTLMLSCYVDLNWLNLGWADAFLPPHEGQRILLVATPFDRANFDALSRRADRDVVFKNRDLLILDTGLRVTVPPAQKGLKGLSPTRGTNAKGYHWPRELMPQWEQLVREQLE